MLFAMFLGCHLAIVVSFFLIARKNNIQLGFYFDSLIIFLPFIGILLVLYILKERQSQLLIK